MRKTLNDTFRNKKSIGNFFFNLLTFFLMKMRSVSYICWFCRSNIAVCFNEYILP